MAEIEGEIFKWTNQALAKIKALQQESNLTAFEIVNFDFFKTHSIMLVAHNFGVDWGDNVNKLFRPLDCVDMEIMDEDIVDVLLTKGQALWEPDGTCMAHNALLLCNTVNRSSTIALSEPWYGCVISATVVWVALDQARLSVPDTVNTLLIWPRMTRMGWLYATFSSLSPSSCILRMAHAYSCCPTTTTFHLA